MRTELCLEYQARANGKSNGIYQPNRAKAGHYKIKYKPCRDCLQGKEIVTFGGKDSDVELLKQKIDEKYCRYCALIKPISDFYESTKGSGKYAPECKACASARHKKAKEVKRLAESVEITTDITPDITPDITNDLQTDEPVSNNPEAVFISSPPSELSPILYTCRQCGQTKSLNEMYKFGGSFTSVCRACVIKNRLEKTQTPKITLDFSQDLEYLEILQHSAKVNRRTLENEILFRLTNHGVMP